MDNTSSASLDNSRSAALCAVQVIGVIAAFSCAMSLPDYATISPALLPWLRRVIGFAVIITVVAGLAHRAIWPSVIGGLGMRRRPGCFNFESLLPTYALLDFAALTFCIYATGGPYESPYTSFLLIIVPVAITLQERRIFVAAYAFLTIILFWATLYWNDVGFQPRAGSSGVTIWFAIITSVCAGFPAFLYILKDDQQAPS